MNIHNHSATAPIRARAPMEHRWGSRIAIDHPVTFNGDTGRLINASVSGALIETEAQIPLLARIDVTIHLAPARTLTLVACVVRREPGAVALEWRDMAARPLVEMLREADAEATLCARD